MSERVKQLKRGEQIRERRAVHYEGFLPVEIQDDVDFLLEEIDRLNTDRIHLMERYDAALRREDNLKRAAEVALQLIGSTKKR